MSALLLLVVAIWSIAVGEPMPMEFDEFEMSSEDVLDRDPKRRATIEFLDAKLTEEHEEAQRVQLLLRLAHLYHEEGRANRDVEMLRRAASYYRRIQAEHPAHERRDHVAFYLAFARLGGQQDPEAEGLAQMIRAYPTSRYVPHAHLHRAEQLFRLKRYEEAAGHYRSAAADERFPFELFARYKGIWSLYRLGREAEALEGARALARSPRLGALRPLLLEMVAYWSDELGVPLQRDLYGVQVMREPDRGCEVSIPELRNRQRGAGDFDAQDAIVRCYVARGRLGLARAELAKTERRYGRGTRWFRVQSADNRRRVRRALRALARDVGR